MKYVLFLCIQVLFLFFAATAWADNIPVVSKSPSGLYGYVDEAGKYVIQPQFEQAFPFGNDSARVIWKGGWYLINTRGKFLTRKSYTNIGVFRNNLAITSVQGSNAQLLYGLVTEKGDEVVTPRYNYLTPEPNYSFFIVGQEEKTDAEGHRKISFGLLSKEGKWIIPAAFSAIRHTNFQAFAAKNTAARWEVFDAAGKALFGGKYDEVKDFDTELATVKINGKWGIVRADGKLVVKADYRDIQKKSSRRYDLIPFIQWKVVNDKQQTVLTMEYEDVRPVHPSIYSYQIEGKTGLLNERGERLTKPLYDAIQPFVKEMGIVQLEGRCGVISPKGEVLIPLQYEHIQIDTTARLLKVRDKGLWGVVNKAHRTIVPARYDSIRIQRYGMFTARKADSWYLLDATGQPLNSQTFDKLGDIQNLYAVAYQKNRAGLINLRSTWAIEPTYDSLRVLNEYVAQYYLNGRSGLISILSRQNIVEADMVEPIRNYLRVIANGKYGVWNPQGKVVVPIQYDYISNFTEDSVLTVFQGKKKGLISLNGTPILKPSAVYEELLVMKNERVGVKLNNKYGFVDNKGRLRIANRYEGIGSFSENAAAVKILGKWGFIDKAENIIIQPNYEAVGLMEHGVAPVRKGGKWGLANKTGKEILKCSYDGVNWLPTGRYLISLNGKKGLANEVGKELFPPKYDLVTDNDNGFVMLGKNGKLGLSDNRGYDVLPVIYDRLYFNASRNFYITGIESPVQTFVYQP